MASERVAMAKEQKLETLLQELGSAMVAFSGGVDSTFLLYKAASTLGREKLLAVTADSPLHPAEEKAAAAELAASLGVNHLFIETDELSREEFCANPPERCYYCKKIRYTRLAHLVREKRLQHLLDGSNLDDASDYRPGIQAARELGVRSPLQEAGLTKEEIRLLSRRYHLSTWDKPAAASLASRIAYGERLEPGKLRQVEQAERFLHSLGLKREVRVRLHGPVARLEVHPAELDLFLAQRRAVVEQLKQLGFPYVTLDLEGFQSGSMNRVLENK